MFEKKVKPIALDDLIEQKITDNDKNFFFEIKEIKIKTSNKPYFKLYLKTPEKDREVKLNAEETKFNIDEIVDFFYDIKKENKDFSLSYNVEALMPQYESLLYDQVTDKLNQKIKDNSQYIWDAEIIKEINEEKICKLTVKQQKDLFIDLCCSGNDKPISQLLNYSIFSSNGSAYNISDPINYRGDFTKDDIILGLKRAASYGHLNTIKTVLENENIKNLFIFSENSRNLSTVIDWALIKERREIISYLIDEKGYKLASYELRNLQDCHSENKYTKDIYNEFINNYQSMNPENNKLKI